MRSTVIRLTTLLVSLLVFITKAGVVAAADDRGEKGATTVVRTEEGLRFQLPPDWPVEKRGGVVGPIPIEEYLSRKFSAMDARLKTLEQQAASLELRLRVLEEEIKTQERLRSVEQQP